MSPVAAVRRRAAVLVGLALLLLPHRVAAAGQPTVVVLAEADSLDPSLIDTFEQGTGVRVFVDSAPTPDAMAASLRRGGVDVALLAADSLRGFVKAGLLARLDAVPAADAVQPELTRRLAALDEAGPHAVAFDWFRTVWVANEAKLADRHVSLDGASAWDIAFKADVSRRLADCGIGLPDDPRDAYAVALAALARNPAAPDGLDGRRAILALGGLRTAVQRQSMPALVDGIVTGTLCAALLPEPGAWQATERVRGTDNGVRLRAVTPDRGRLFVDVLAIPVAAPNRADALRLVAFLLDPGRAAQNARYAHVTSAVGAADTAPSPATWLVAPEIDPATARSLAAAWTRSKPH